MDFLRITVMIIICLTYTNGLLCPAGYTLMRNTLPVDNNNLTWHEAAMECVVKNGTIINVKENDSKQTCKDTMKRYSLNKAWIGHSSEIQETSDQISIQESYFIMMHISDSEFSASYKDGQAKKAKIDSGSAWVSNNNCQWIEVNLKKTMCIHGIVTKGHKNKNQWTKVYKLLYKNNAENFRTLWDDGTEEFPANTDNQAPAYRNFTKPFNAQFIRLYPQEWNDAPAIRFDLLVSNDRCPINFICGNCPTMIITTEATLKTEYEPCCSKLPYICETWSCQQNQVQFPDVMVNVNTTTHLTTKNTTHVMPFYSMPAVTVTDTPNEFLNATIDGRQEMKLVSNNAALITGLTIGMVLFVIISVILFILLIVLYRKQMKKADFHHYENSMRENNPTGLSNMHQKDMNTYQDGAVPDMIYTNIDSYDAPFDNRNGAKSYIKDEPQYDTMDNPVYLELSADNENSYSNINKILSNDGDVKQKEHEMVDDIEMVQNEIYNTGSNGEVEQKECRTLDDIEMVQNEIYLV